jgi:hypothetical protein
MILLEFRSTPPGKTWPRAGLSVQHQSFRHKSSPTQPDCACLAVVSPRGVPEHGACNPGMVQAVRETTGHATGWRRVASPAVSAFAVRPILPIITAVVRCLAAGCGVPAGQSPAPAPATVALTSEPVRPVEGGVQPPDDNGWLKGVDQVYVPRRVADDVVFVAVDQQSFVAVGQQRFVAVGQQRFVAVDQQGHLVAAATFKVIFPLARGLRCRQRGSHHKTSCDCERKNPCSSLTDTCNVSNAVVRSYLAQASRSCFTFEAS